MALFQRWAKLAAAGSRSLSSMPRPNSVMTALHRREAARIGAGLTQVRAGDRVAFDMPQTLGADESRKPEKMEGLIIAVKGSGINRTFTLRRRYEGVMLGRCIY
jgi:ribosomal protein L19